VRYAGEDTPGKWYVVEARQTVGYLVVSDVSHPAYLWEEVSVTRNEGEKSTVSAIFSCLKLENETGAREREKKKRREKERKKRGRKGGKKSFPSLSYSHH